MSDGKLLNDAMAELRCACGLSDGPETLELLARAAALVREAMAARVFLLVERCSCKTGICGRHPSVSFQRPRSEEDESAYAAARAAAGEE